jgi:YVTN family beta-propeller protein
VIDGNSNTVVNTITVGDRPGFVAVNPNTNFIYVSTSTENTVTVIDGATNIIIATVPVGCFSYDIGILP